MLTIECGMLLTISCKHTHWAGILQRNNAKCSVSTVYMTTDNCIEVISTRMFSTRTEHYCWHTQLTFYVPSHTFQISNVRRGLYTYCVHTVYTVHCTLYTLYTVYITHCVLYTVYTIHCVLYTLCLIHSVFYTVYITHYVHCVYGFSLLIITSIQLQISTKSQTLVSLINFDTYISSALSFSILQLCMRCIFSFF